MVLHSICAGGSLYVNKWPPSWTHPNRKTNATHSPDYRLHLPCNSAQKQGVDPSLQHSGHPDSPCPAALRRVDLHGARPTDHIFGRRAPERGFRTVDDQDICDRRRHCLSLPGCRFVHPHPWHTGEAANQSALLLGGGIMSSGTIENYELGEDVTVAGLAVQLTYFSIFMVTCGIFHRRIRNNPTQQASALAARLRSKTTRTWETVLYGLYIASILILVRSIFRLVEYVQGNAGYLISHEVFMYVFDAALMWVTMVVMNAAHPSMILVGSQKDRNAEMQEVGPGEVEGLA